MVCIQAQKYPGANDMDGWMDGMHNFVTLTHSLMLYNTHIDTLYVFHTVYYHIKTKLVYYNLRNLYFFFYCLICFKTSGPFLYFRILHRSPWQQ